MAHFYRTVEIWPIFDPKVILAASPTPLYATIAKPLFLGGSGTLKITASLHRAVWIAGQRCYVKIFIANDTEKRTVKALTLSLIRFETVFKPEVVTSTPSRQKSVKNEDAGQTSTVKRFVTQSILEMGEKATKRRATAKGWWTGVEPGAFYEFNHHILLPVRMFVCYGCRCRGSSVKPYSPNLTAIRFDYPSQSFNRGWIHSRSCSWHRAISIRCRCPATCSDHQLYFYRPTS